MTTDYTDRARSWSQLSSYEQCPQAFFLERIEKAWQRPAAWFATGLGVHSAVEAYEKGEADHTNMLRVAQDAFRRDIDARLVDTPNASFWQASGPYKGPEDITRRYNDLGRHLNNYLQVAPTLGDVWYPVGDGLDDPAVEYPIDLNLDGVRVIGSIDQVRWKLETEDDDQPDLEIWDVKAGSMTPDEPGQLAVYATAVRKDTGYPVKQGGYIMTAKKPTAKGAISKAQVVRKDLTLITEDALTARFHAADEGIRAERWGPTPGDQCGRCSVLTSCPVGQAHVRGN